MRKHLSIWVLLLVLVMTCGLVLAACGNTPEPNQDTPGTPDETQSDTPDVTEPQVTLRIGSELPDNDNFEAVAMRTLSEDLAEIDGIEVKFYPAAALGDQVSVYGQVSRGQCDISGVTASNIAGVDYPNLAIFDIPYLFADMDVAIKVLDPAGEVTTALRDDMISTNGVRLLCLTPNGFRQLTNNTREVKAVEDLNKLKIRTMSSNVQVASWEASGAQVTPMAFGELYSALQTGVVDGQENPLIVILNNSLNEVQKYVTITNHLLAVNALVMNEATYQKLSDTQKAVLDQLVADYYIYMCDEAVKAAENILDDIIDQNLMQVTELTPEQLQSFRDKMQPTAVDLVRDFVDDEAFVDLLLEEIAKNS